MSDLDTKHLCWCINHKYMLLSIIYHTQANWKHFYWH